MKREELNKIIELAYFEVLQEGLNTKPQLIKEEKNIQPSEVPQEFLDKIEYTYGPVDMENDFFSPDYSNYFKFSKGEDDETGSRSHKVIKLPSFEHLFFYMSDAVLSTKELIIQDAIKADPKAKKVFLDIVKAFNELRTYLRTQHPGQYKAFKAKRLQGAIGEEQIAEVFPAKGKIYKAIDTVNVKGLRLSKNAKVIVSKVEDTVITVKVDLVSFVDIAGNTRQLPISEFKETFKPSDEVQTLSELRLNKEAEEKPAPEGEPEPKPQKVEPEEKGTPDEGEPDEKETPEEWEAGPETSLEDSTEIILTKFPTLKAAIEKLMTTEYGEFIESIDWISPRPSTFKINIMNGNNFTLRWTGTGFQAKIMGKNYYIGNIAEFQQALDKLAILYKEGPIKGDELPAESSDLGGSGGGSGGGGGEFPGDVADFGTEPEGGEELGGEEAGGEDLSGEEIDFEEPGEEPKV